MEERDDGHGLPDEGEFKGTERYVLRRRLGAGGVGVVYEAFDRERQEIVALKTLKRVDGARVARFKNEFRALADVSHANLVRLSELHCDAGRWFFTMELVPGEDFVSWVRAAGEADETTTLGATPRYDEGKLRDGLRQLALGVASLHDAGMVHRDLKPSNVPRDPAGRVVILDFGLVTHIDSGNDSIEGNMVGTPAYMAPEQAASERPGPAADWYSVGVILYEILVGQLPFEGPSLQLLSEKLRSEPVSPSARRPSVPADLDRLCMALLRGEAAQRPDARTALLAYLDTSPRIEPRSLEPRSHTTGNPLFVGRGPELAALEEAWNAVSLGHSVAVVVEGESGVGKSALLQHFTRELEANAGALILRGRCHEREELRYKAFDRDHGLARSQARASRWRRGGAPARRGGGLRRAIVPDVAACAAHGPRARSRGSQPTGAAQAGVPCAALSAAPGRGTRALWSW